MYSSDSAADGGALGGIKVLELNMLSPAAFTTVMLADMGADVIRITRPTTGSDPLEAMWDTPRKVAGNWLDRNKRWLQLDLKSPEGVEVFNALAREADVVVDGFRPGVLDRLGLGYEAISANNPGIVYCAMSGFGQTGPYRLRPAHDLDFLALSGVLSMLGRTGSMPTIPMNVVADYAGASMHAALGIMFALFARVRTGRGQKVDISYLDTTLAVLSASPPVTAWLGGGPEPSPDRGIFTAEFPYYSIYADRDGRLMTISATEPWLFANLCEVVGRPDLVSGAMPGGAFSAQPGPEDARVRAGLAEALRARTREEWFELLGAANVCVGIVNDVPAAFADPQVVARDMALRLDSPDVADGVLHPGVAIKLSETPGQVRTLPAAPGQHTDQILRELGYPAATIAAFHDRKLI